MKCVIAFAPKKRPAKKSPPENPIDHTYHDYSNRDASEFSLPPKSGTATFPLKLYEILADPNNHDAIRWMPHGRAWKVIDKDKLEMVLSLSEHFQHGSFVR